MSFARLPRIAPLSPPYSPDIAASLAKWMPPGSTLEPLKLFRTLYQNPHITGRMRPLGAGILGPQSSLHPRAREIVIDRTCANCGCEYEWGVHVAAYGSAVGLAAKQLEDTVSPTIEPGLWSEQEQALIAMVDELCETATLSDAVWDQLATFCSDAQMLELIITVGWYHLISFVANATHVESETWAVQFPEEKKANIGVADRSE
ncbi:MAG: carboxymuconolactone decarboxylase family protein [Ktedonobacteraceae bacterium]|nr:carboxymuconolactone decarboxylase family protein [Ktedonobacteraceae bacterium]